MTASVLSHRSLALIKKSGSTSRILNLHAVHEKFGDTPEFAEKPFFRSKRLNSAMILKHSLRGAEQYLFGAPRANATKLLLPLANEELSMGGANVFVGQRGFEGALRDLGYYRDDDSLQKDIELLLCLDRLPSLDPFLLREQVKRINRDPARCFFQISDNDLKQMQDFVGDQVGRLIEMAFSGSANKDISHQMATKILADENAETLAPLKAALGLDGQEWTDGVFCWKGFLYYKWAFRNLVPQASTLIKHMKSLSLGRCEPTSVSSIRRMMDRAQGLLQEKVQNISRLLKVYDIAYDTMTVEKKPGAFREFLLNSPQMFVEIGESAGVVGHLAGFWSYKFRGNQAQFMTTPELIDLFQEFENCRVAEGGTQSTESVWVN